MDKQSLGFSPSNLPGGQKPDSANTVAIEEKQRQEEEMKKELLSRILEQDARERLGRIAIVKPEKASAVESMLINMARSGRLRGKVSEDDLIGLLERINDETQKQTRIVFNRKGFDDESEEEEYDF